MRHRYACVAALCALSMGLCSACTAQESAPGRLSLLRHVGRPEGVELTNLTYTLLQEKVLKVHAVTLAPTQGGLGARRYAGSFTVGTGAPGKPFLFELPAEQRTASSAPQGPLQAEVTLSGKGDGWTCDETAHFAVGYPVVWLKLRASGTALPLRGSLMGWGWVPARTPESWWTPAGPHQRPAGAELRLAGTDCAVLAWADAANGWGGALAFTNPPREVVITDDGISFEYPDGVAEADVAYLVAVPGTAGPSAKALLAALAAPPTNYRLSYGAGARGPWVEYANDAAATATLTFAAPKGASLPLAGGLAGRLWLGAAPRERVTLTERPGFDLPVPDLKPLPPAVGDRVAAMVKELIARQEPDGRYTYGEQRGFWDGITATILAQALPLLPDADRAAATASVKRCLDHLWRDQTDCVKFPGLRVPPEQPPFMQGAIDYPEIMGCVLEATLTYAINADPGYVQAHWPDIERHFKQLREWQDWTGPMFASGGPDFTHIIAESAIGGYFAWHALHHLAKLAGDDALADEARGRAAYDDYGFRRIFARRQADPPAIVNGWIDHTLQLEREPAWVYVQYTCFSYLPVMLLDPGDTYGLWDALERQPWWEWTGKLGSRQRVYDGMNELALWRTGHQDPVRAHWREVGTRPCGWETWDFTPIFEVAALCWLGGELGVPDG